MFNNTIDRKPLIKTVDGIEIRDLCESIFDKNNRLTSKVNIYKVNKSYIMRPDLISQAAYNTTDDMELILKVNGISNPFSIDEDDIIIIPDKNEIGTMVKQKLTETDNISLVDNYKYIDESKIPVKSEDVKSFEDRFLTDAETVLPPNISQNNESQVNIRNNRVYFGENVGKSCLRSGMSLSDYMSTVIKSK